MVDNFFPKVYLDTSTSHRSVDSIMYVHNIVMVTWTRRNQRPKLWDVEMQRVEDRPAQFKDFQRPWDRYAKRGLVGWNVFLELACGDDGSMADVEMSFLMPVIKGALLCITCVCSTIECNK